MNIEKLKNMTITSINELIEQQQARIEELKKASEWVSVDDVKFLLSFAPKDKPESVPKGLNPMFYHTLSYEGDYDITIRLEKIRRSLPKPPEGKS